MPAAKPRPQPPVAKKPEPEPAPVSVSPHSRPLSGPSTGFELDIVEEPEAPAGGKQTMVAGSMDDMEFDPTSVANPGAFGEFGASEQELSDAGGGGELDLDLSSSLSASEAPQIHNAPASVDPSRNVTLLGGPEAALGQKDNALDLDFAGGDEDLIAPGPAAAGPAAASPAAASPAAPRPGAETLSLSSHATATAPPSAAPGHQSVPALDVPSISPAPAGPALAAPQAASPPAQAPDLSALDGMVSSGMPAFPGMGGDVDLGGDLDDLGGAAAAQLNIGVPMAEPQDDAPWPTGVTPQGDELAVSREEAEEISGFGPAPKGIVQTPMYALRVFTALRELRDKDSAAQKRLEELEQSRDEKLANLAESKRAELQGKDRFASLYAEVDKHDENIMLKKRALETADMEGADALRAVQLEIDTKNIERQTKQKVYDDRQLVFSQSEQTLARHQAALKRIQIQWRNIEQQAQKYPGDEMPDELDAQLDALEEHRETEKRGFELAKEQRRVAKKLLTAAEDDLRLAIAEVRGSEGQKEGLLMAYEGDIAAHSRALDKAIAHKHQKLADAGRVIVDLRGEVKVDADIRRDLIAADAAVETAARHRETVRLALASMDDEAYGTGKAVWIGSVAALFVLLLWAAF